jgi:hypothetical protein
MTRIRTLEFLPSIFQTPTNSQFLAATLDQLVNPPLTKKIQGYVGSKFGYGVNANDFYVTEPTKVRTDYQLEPGVTFLKNNESVAKDFISYPGILDALKLQGGITTDNSKLFNSQFYSWDSFTNLDMIINYNQYYWLPEGPPAVIVASDTVFLNNEYIVESLPNTYNIRAIGAGAGADNPTITLIRGGTYNFYVDQDTEFWIQGKPGVTGKDPSQPNINTRMVYGVDNNGEDRGIVTFNVPFKDAQNEFNFPGNNLVDVVSTLPFSQVNGARLSDINNIDGVTSLNGRTVMFYNPNNRPEEFTNEIGYVSNFFAEGTYDTNYGNLVAPITKTATAISGSGDITLSNVANLSIGGSITFSGPSFGGLFPYTPLRYVEIPSSSMTAGLMYWITELGDTNWINAGVTSNATLNGEINGNLLTVETVISGAFNIGMTITGSGIASGTTITGYDAETSGLTGKDTYYVSVSQTVPNTNIDVYDLSDGKIFTSTGPLAGTGKVRRYQPVIYYIKTINSVNNTITISLSLDGPTYVPSAAAIGNMIVRVNEGLYEEGFYVNVNDYFFNITYVGDVTDPVLKLTPVPNGLIPSEQKITAQFGTNYIGQNFFKNDYGYVQLIPYISAPLDILYYQDNVNPNKVGVIRLIESNALNTLNVNTEILGKKNFTSTNGVVFTNGLKVEFDGDVIPTSYLSGQYYVQGVGTAIELIPVDTLVVPESFTTQTSLPYDTTNFDIGNFDASLFVPENPDYITIARNSINKNAWSRSNRWFHSDVIKATSEYNDNPDILTTFANATNKAKRPILEFYPNLKLFNSGTVGKSSVDFVDTRTTDAFSAVAGQAAYYPDVETYTNYSTSATIAASPTVTQGQFLLGQQYRITNIGTTAPAAWVALGVNVFVEGEFVPGIEYVITLLGSTDWNAIAGTADISPSNLTVGKEYEITILGNTDWNSIGYIGVPIVGGTFIATATGSGTGLVDGVYEVGSIFTAVYSGETVGSGGGQAAETLFTAQSTGVINSGDLIADLEYTITELGTTLWNNISYYDPLNPSDPDNRSWGAGDPVVGGTFIATAAGVGTGYATQGDGTALSLTATTITIPASTVVGNLTVGMYINDQIRGNQSQLPTNTRILSIDGTSTYTITVFYPLPTIIPGSASLIYPPSFTPPEISFVANSKNNSDLLLFAGARIVFLNESNPIVKNKIYVANYSTTVSGLYPIITLTEALDGEILANDQFAVLRGQNYQGTSFYYDGENFIQAQQKTTINQPPKFDVYDKNGISFGNEDFYESTTFNGCDLLRYKIGTGANDSVLGFPISYSSLNNVGDITFEVALNTDTFNYVTGIQQNVTETQKVNTGYVYNVTSRTEFERLLGWQTAVAPSTQYQIFEFKYTPDPSIEFAEGDTIFYTVNCDVSQLSVSDTIWPSLEVYNNNNILIINTDYTVENGSDFTNITVQIPGLFETVIQVAILSNQTSQNAYYSIPINLSNNPFNSDVTTVDIGDIRGHYQSIFYNNPDTTGVVFGANNTRDLGNIVPWGNRIIQNSASLVLPGSFLRQAEHSLFDSLLFNSREYIKFKSLLIDTANKIDWQQRYNPSALLDEALDQITSVKNQEMPFFWSDMIPNKAPFITNTYTFFNNIDTSTFPLSKIYNFDAANYDGVLVYLQTTAEGTTITKQLVKNIDYTISSDTPSLIVTKDLINGDKIVIKEYNQTYGSYVPNTPTKLGLYPASVPSVILDSSYNQPTYFILGHDGSYTKLYGNYDPVLGLIDYRDQVLLEFETRVYNNLKLSNTIPIQAADIIPGYFRDNTVNYDEWLSIYSSTFLDWVGQNRLDYKTQLYLSTNEYTYNYTNSRNKLDNAIIQQGNWRGIYMYYFDTSTPNTTPWEMIGYANKPSWWETQYGPAPYTSDNLILWQDMENGYDYNNGNPVEIEIYKRPGLLNILPVDDQGNLINPLFALVGNYNPNTFQRDWTIGDVGPVEFSYRRSSTWPFDLMRLQALLKPANFFNLGVDIDNYKYNAEFNQFLINDRTHLVPADIEIYGNGTAKTSYINWIVDYEKQLGVNATENIKKLLTNLDVRLVYRLAGFSDKTLLKFFVEKGTPGSKNSSLLIPDESYQILLYENQPYDKLIYSSAIVQLTENGYKVFGNSQTTNYFKTLVPIINSNTKTITVEDQSVKVADDYESTIKLVPYGTLFYTAQEVAQFLMSYGAYLESAGAKFDVIESGIELNWEQMVAEYLYWTQVGWSIGSIVTLNPAANTLVIDKESQIVQPLTFQQTNFVLNQNLYPIETKDLAILRDGTAFSVSALNAGDSVAYGQFNLSNIEHGIVFDNTTIFGDVIYNLVSGLKQNRISLQGTKSAEWNGTMFASGFIYNQDNVEEWRENTKYTKGAIVKFKNKYFTALAIIQPSKEFRETEWKETDYNEIQKGLLPNSSTRSYESSLYYNTNEANLEDDADQVSFSLIGFRSRPYMASADLTDITQVNVYKNFIKEKGTRAALSVFKGANLPQGGIDYNIYENWAIMSGTFGGVLNNNFIEFKLNQNVLTGNPGIVGLTTGQEVEGAQQIVPLYSLTNYGQPVSDSSVLPTVSQYTPNTVFPDAGYVNFNDVKMSAYFFEQLAVGVNQNGIIVPINDFYVGDYVWLANYLAKWQVMTPNVIAQVVEANANLNGTTTIIFDKPHNLNQFDIFAIINFDNSVNGYYVATQIVNPYQVIVPLILSNGVRTITGQGIAYNFSSQRVDQPSDIQNLNLLSKEFVKNTAWVDLNNDGGWAVYRKGINYQYDEEFTIENSVTFGSSVAYTSKGDYLFGDAGAGKVYRFQYDALNKIYEQDQTITNDVSFGTNIAYAQNIYAISQATVDPTIYFYYVNDTTITDDIEPFNTNTNIVAPIGATNFGTGLAMSGDANWLYIGDYDTNPLNIRNKVHVYRRNNSLVSATNLDAFKTYQITELGDTDFTTLGAVENKVGIYFVYNDVAATGTGTVTNVDYEFVTTLESPEITADKFGSVLSTNYYGDVLVVGAPEYDYDINTENWGKAYVYNRIIQNFEVQENSSATPATFTLAFTPSGSVDPIIYRNGTKVSDTNYSIVGTSLIYTGTLKAGDIIEVDSCNFSLAQVLTTETNPRIGVMFGTGLDTNKYGTEILVGAPFALNSTNEEGAVYRFTNAGARFGIVIGTENVDVTTNRDLLINGYLVTIPPGDSDLVALTINQAKITNVEAVSTNGKLIISVINQDLAPINEKLVLNFTDQDTLTELGLTLFNQTQVIQCPHLTGPTQFGTTIAFNESNSVVISAPSGTRYAQTTFDFVDDDNYANDLVFDNNATQFIDSYPNAGAVYMYDYLANYEENLNNIGAYTYAQSCNARDQIYGSQPYYGTVLDFNENKVIIGTPTYRPDDIDGQVVVYINELGVPNWSVYRQTNPIVDINRIQNIQIYNSESNQTLINMDYFDPLQGKLLGAIRQNIDTISNVDPATYNNETNTQSGFVWGADQTGKIWLDTTNLRFVNYHQNDNVYNAKYWGSLFPGSDVAVYTWIASNVLPTDYQGPGIPRDVNSYTVQTVINSSNTIQPIYYFWVRNSGLILGNKTLADVNIASYIANPLASGITYFSPVNTNVFALYNSQQYINAQESVLHIGYSNGQNDDPSHQSYQLIREDFASDFLPGFVNPSKGIFEPRGLYDRMLDSLAGVDEEGGVLPDPFLPKLVQTGVLARPRQSFFYNRYKALQNYLQYANTILSLFPITELRPLISFLNEKGDYYDTTLYWERVNWWAPGYDNNTKAAIQVPLYADLSTLNVSVGTIVAVNQNSQGFTEFYRFDENGIWTRIGLQNGTIRFKTELWNYDEGQTGYGDDFYGTTPYDQYPSEETRWIIRALNEQIYTNDLLIYRNKSLILLFEYIQAETVENQNYLPWLNKTSLVDVSHKIRELVPLQNFKSDNQEFLSGYVNEVKPYHVVIKEFLFEYTGEDIYQGNLTDFDLPATYDFTTQSFISPQLVYSNPNQSSEFLPDDSIWELSQYTEWRNNYGVSLVGQDNYLITTTVSYLPIGATFLILDNAQGFPINGTIKIADVENPSRFEIIGYSSVDTSTNTLFGLTRGLNGTEEYDHIPGENVYIDLPAVVVLDGGRGYSNPPRVLAQIDLSKYPAPKEEAVLEAVMSLDSVVAINVINPGIGYPVLPNIIIEPAASFTFGSDSVTAIESTIELYAPDLQTGDLVRYVKVSGQNIGGLENNQYYYINVLSNSPLTILALYANYSDAIKDQNRVEIYSQGSGSDHKFELGAKASAISSSYPVRENNITLRFDRTTYDTQVTDWVPGSFYGAFFAGSYNNTENISSSSIELQSTLPPINTILSSNDGLVLPLVNVDNERVLDWSEFERNVLSTNLSSNIITLDVDVASENASGSTIGFTVGMPIKFIGTAGTSSIVSGTTYYVNEIISDTQFKISATQYGTVYNVGNSSAGTDFKCYTAQIIDTAIVSTYYPGIRTVTATSANNSIVTIPLTDIGTGGTAGLYTGIPVVFTGNVFGNIEEHVVYFVTSVLDDENFTISDTDEFVRIKALSINAANQIIVQNTTGLNVNDRIVFSNMTIEGEAVTEWGNIQQGTIYYVKTIDVNVITISEILGGATFAVSPVTSNSQTYCFFVDQENNFTLDNASGNMTINIQLPASPGQVNGQLFTFYPTSNQYVNITSTDYGNLVERTVEYASSDANLITLTSQSGGTNSMYIGMPITVDQNIGGLVANTTYTIEDIGEITVAITNSSASSNTFTVDGTVDSLYIDMPIVFSGNPLGSIIIGVTYYVESIDTINNKFTIKDSLTGTELALTTNTGSMIGTGPAYIKLNTTITSNQYGPVTLNQKITTDPVFDVSYILGGYRVIISDPGAGFTVNNTITIPGNLLGGYSPQNDLTLKVNKIDAIVPGTYSWSLPIESNGNIINVICSGTPNATTNNYYLKVIGSNTFKVYSDPRMTVPVSGLTLGYDGATISTANTVASNGVITVDDASLFEINNSIVFTGDVFGSITLGQTYYITNINTGTNEITISDEPGGSPVVTTPESGTMTVATPGSYMFLPEPFYFNQSIVKYNNRVYICVVSNNDDQFVFGKWEELNSGDRRLNAMDRVKGYYQPTINMPGTDLNQLFAGVTYPNTTYKGNAFDPAEQYEIDTLLQDQIFYPDNVNITGIAWDGVNYIAPANLPNYTALAKDIEVTDDWLLGRLSNKPLSITDIIKTDDLFVMTSTNSATPILTSTDGTGWSTNGFFIPFGVEDNELEFERKLLIQSKLTFNKVAYGNGKYVAVGENICTSDSAVNWLETYKFDTGSNGYIYDVAYGSTSFFTGFIAVGTKNSTKIFLQSIDGITWIERTAFDYSIPATLPQRNATLRTVTFGSSSVVIGGDLGVVYRWPGGPVVYQGAFGSATSWNDALFAQNTFAIVGNNGKLLTSANGINWVEKATGTTENLNKIYYNTERPEWTIAGNNNTLFQTLDITTDPIVWDKTQLFSIPDPAYTVKGDPFMSGYGPEELVPGIVTDQLTMIVNTRPGTNWAATEYAHVGYNVVSVELDYESNNEYSFADVVAVPSNISVYVITDGLATGIYSSIDYTVDYVNKTIELTTNISNTQQLRVDVYEVGNGDQLIKSNTQIDPLRQNNTTGFQEILLNCNYTAERLNGGGIIRPATDPTSTDATATDSLLNTITVNDVSIFTVNDDVYFTGEVFGNLEENTPYYVKTIDPVQKTITVSETINDGIAGPIFNVSSDSGNMVAVAQNGPGQYWTPPAVLHNGNRLINGETNLVVRSKSSSNSLITYSTVGLLPNQKIIFDNNIFGGLVPHQTYYIKDVFTSGTEFTVSETEGGSVVVLNNALGKSNFITQDYAVMLADNQISAKVVFAAEYNTNTDYISFTFFGETLPTQYGYTVPETQVFYGNGTRGNYYLTNYLGEDNDTNAIVEVNGLRIMPDQYVINYNQEVLVFDTLEPTSNDVIAVTTFNDTQRQYLNTQYELSPINVISIDNVYNTITTPLIDTQTLQTQTVGSTLYYVASNITNFIVGQNIVFQVAETGSIPFGGVQIDGTVYTLVEVNGNNFRVEDENGISYPSGSGTGLMHVVVGGQPAVRVQTTDPHQLSTNDLVRIDGITGSVQLNNNIFYVHVISETLFDLYQYFPDNPEENYSPYVDAVNHPITICDSYVSDGYVWLSNTWTLETTTVTSCTSLELSVDNVLPLVLHTPVYFTENNIALGEPTSIPQIIAGEKYYISGIDVDNNTITISETIDGTDITLAPQGTTNIVLTQWEQTNVDRLWVTVNGERVPSSSLRLNAGNQVSILAPINIGDEIIITSMMPSATPNELVYVNTVNKNNEGTVYRANGDSRTWLTEALTEYQNIVYVNDINNLTYKSEQTNTTPAKELGYYYIPLNADKNDIIDVSIYNNAAGRAGYIEEDFLQLEVRSTGAFIRIQEGDWIEEGDSLTITVYEGKIIYMQGEYMRVLSVDQFTNSMEVERGANGSGIQVYIPKYSEVYSFLDKNTMTNINYNDTWNKIPGLYNSTMGDPLQIAIGSAAEFLRMDE